MKVTKITLIGSILIRSIALCWVLALMLAVPMVCPAANVTLKPANDASGTTSFTGSTNWSNNAIPSAGNNYFTGTNFLRTPPDGNNYTFGGSSLTLQTPAAQGAPMRSMIFKGFGGNVYTINNFTNAGGVINCGSGNVSWTLAGNMFAIASNSTVSSDQGPIIINSPLVGSGNLTNNNSTPAYGITYNGTNTFTGNTIVSGMMTLGTNGIWTFKLGGSGTNNSISGSGSATFNGSFSFDLSSASTNLGDSWQIAAVANQTFGSTFSVAGFSRVGGFTGAGIWQAATNGTFYSFNTTNGFLQVVSSIITNTVVAASVPVFATPIEADVLVGYAASYAASVGGQDNVSVIAANNVAGNNAVQDRSGTGTHMRLAGCYQSANDVTGQTTTGGIITWLANNDSHLSDVVAQGAAVGADLVVYICQNSDYTSISGVSQQPGFYSSINPGGFYTAVFAHETGGHSYGRAHADGVPNPVSIMLNNYCPGGGAAPPYYYSNPKIWFKGVQMLGPGSGNDCSQGSPVNNGDNTAPTETSAQAMADRRARVIVGPDLNNVILHWMFTNAPGLAPAGTTNYDLVSGAPAVVRGVGAFYTGTTLRIPGGTTGNVPMNSMAAYLDLPNGIISSQTNITIEIWATPLSAPSWARICEFGRASGAGDGLGAPGEYTGAPTDPAPGTTSSQDAVLLSAANGTTITSQRFEIELAGAATNLDSALATVAGVQHHYAITFTDGAGIYSTNGGRWQWYRDGDLVAYLDASNHLSVIQDVNNWLGRSQFSADSLANNDYAEVRISNVAMSRGQILANYLLGADYNLTSTVMLTNSDATGASSFSAAGQWSNGSSPAGVNSYETFGFSLGTPATGSSYAFGGNALEISGGTLLWQGTSSSTITVPNLTLNSGTVRNAGSGNCTLAGNLTSTNSGGTINAVNGPITLAANLQGGGPITFLANGTTTTLSGHNTAFTGQIFLGNGSANTSQVGTTLVIDSLARLGASPSSFVANQLDLNRGTLKTTTTFSLNDTNRGIMLDVSGGTFDVASGTTLTVSSPLSSPAAPAGYNVVAGALTKADSGTLILNSPTNSFIGTLYVDSGSTTANDGIVKVINNQVLAVAHSPIFINNNNSGSSTLQLDGTSGNITLPQQISLNGRSSAVAAIENVAGTNTISGGISINVGGGNYWIQSDAGLLNLGGTISAGATGARPFTFLGNGNLNVTGIIADGSATVSVAKSGNGTLTLAGGNTYSGATTLSAGTLLVNGTLGSGGITASGGTLGGNGTVNGAVTIQSGATLAPGGSIGTLTFGTAPTLGGTVLMELNRTNAQTSDQLVVSSGTLTYAGTLTVTNIGPALQAGDGFQLFSAGGYTGSFAATNLPSLASALAWNFNSLSGMLNVVPTVATNPTNITFSVSNGALTLSWPADHTGWRLQTQTNPLLTGLWTNWFDVPGSTGTNQVTQPISPNNPSVFFRLGSP